MNGELIVLTPRAQQQLMVLNALERAEVRMAEAALLLGLSVRQVRRLRRAYHTGDQVRPQGNRRNRALITPGGICQAAQLRSTN